MSMMSCLSQPSVPKFAIVEGWGQQCRFICGLDARNLARDHNSDFFRHAIMADSTIRAPPYIWFDGLGVFLLCASETLQGLIDAQGESRYTFRLSLANRERSCFEYCPSLAPIVNLPTHS